MPTVSHETLNTAAQKFRRELLIMAVLGLGNSIQHMTLRTGIRYKETVGEMDGPVELRPYTGEKNSSDGMDISGRDLETFLGSCVKEFDPNKLVKTLYGAAVTKGEALKNIPINKQVMALMMKKISGGLNKSLFNAVRKSDGTLTKDLYNGLDTIALAEITAGNIALAKKNLYEFGSVIDSSNAVDALKALYRASSDELQDERTKLYIPKSIYNAYCDDYQQTVGATPYNRQFKKTFLEGSDDSCELVPLVGKKNSNIIQLSTKGNMLVGVNQEGEEEQIEVRRGDNPFKLQFVTTMFFGTEYESISPERLMVGKLFQA